MLLYIFSTWLDELRKINHYTQGQVMWIWCFRSLHAWSCNTLPPSLILCLRHYIIQDLDILPTTLAVPQHWRFVIFILVCLALKHTCPEFLVSSPQSFLAFKNKNKTKQNFGYATIIKKEKAEELFLHKEANPHSKHKLLDFVSMVNKTCLATR